MSKNQKNKEKEKIIMTNIKQEAKKQNFKVISNCIYKVMGDYFACAVFWVQCNEDKWTLFLRMNIKAYNYDNLFWEIFEMPENINAKESLRANGAFACPPFQWIERSYEVSTLELMQSDIASAINDFQNEINKLVEVIKLDSGDFNSYILSQKNITDEKLLKMIANISKNDYSVAKEIAFAEIGKGQRGGYRNKGKDKYEYIIEYCNKHINN
ncbi:hypothetical protein [Lysinibacillus sp. FJAT-14222]|uniref:hypothetical protein n=1 Tax=Lysinibacillus sp. FJAT-14222 TaxID=1932366 RepID=UPI0006AF98A4|nr:hypothetical protein [Lysinibacillus sp. FJAT-14222]KOS60623.1 hypothetical protein AN161_22475 [Lysinibacillus sp. FJAT-14222]